jgi:hypothetical protein
MVTSTASGRKDHGLCGLTVNIYLFRDVVALVA